MMVPPEANYYYVRISGLGVFEENLQLNLRIVIWNVRILTDDGKIESRNGQVQWD